MYRTIPTGVPTNPYAREYSRAQNVYVCIINTHIQSVVSVASMSVINAFTDILEFRYSFGCSILEYYLEYHTLTCNKVNYGVTSLIVTNNFRKSIENLCVRDIECNYIIDSCICYNECMLTVALEYVPLKYIQPIGKRRLHRTEPSRIIQHVITQDNVLCFNVLLRRLVNPVSLLSHAVGYDNTYYMLRVLDTGRVSRRDCLRLLKRAKRKERHVDTIRKLHYKLFPV